MSKKNRKTKEFLKTINAFCSTQSYKKLWNYFLEIVKTNSFQSAIKTLREKYQIPPKGFKGRNISYYLPPNEWKPKNKNLIKKLDKELVGLCNKYSLHFISWAEVISFYLFYNKLKPRYDPNSSDLFLLSDLKLEKNEPYSKEIRESDDAAYPIAIRISPYASERDILDYIKKIYNIAIKPAQECYINKNIKIGKIKSKNQIIQKRDEFIYQNRNKSGKEIKRLVSEKFGVDLPYEYIPKIIHRENKKRQMP